VKFWKRLGPLGRALVVLGLLLIALQAPELAFVLDAAYVDLVVALIVAGASSYLAAAGGYWADLRLVLGSARQALRKTHFARPAGFAFSIATIFVGVLVPGCRSALLASWLPALFSSGS
jgi:hypothetical protein